MRAFGVHIDNASDLMGRGGGLGTYGAARYGTKACGVQDTSMYRLAGHCALLSTRSLPPMIGLKGGLSRVWWDRSRNMREYADMYVQRHAPVQKACICTQASTNLAQAQRLQRPRLVGDLDHHAVAERAGWITPVPGGVGPMTIAMLLENTLAAANSAPNT